MIDGADIRAPDLLAAEAELALNRLQTEPGLAGGKHHIGQYGAPVYGREFLAERDIQPDIQRDSARQLVLDIVEPRVFPQRALVDEGAQITGAAGHISLGQHAFFRRRYVRQGQLDRADPRIKDITVMQSGMDRLVGEGQRNIGLVDGRPERIVFEVGVAEVEDGLEIARVIFEREVGQPAPEQHIGGVQAPARERVAEPLFEFRRDLAGQEGRQPVDGQRPRSRQQVDKGRVLLKAHAARGPHGQAVDPGLGRADMQFRYRAIIQPQPGVDMGQRERLRIERAEAQRGLRPLETHPELLPLHGKGARQIFGPVAPVPAADVEALELPAQMTQSGLARLSGKMQISVLERARQGSRVQPLHDAGVKQSGRGQERQGFRQF